MSLTLAGRGLKRFLGCIEYVLNLGAYSIIPNFFLKLLLTELKKLFIFVLWEV
jgi:hypothetical protein